VGLLARSAPRAARVACALVLAACAAEDPSEHYRARGVVEAVQADYGQVVIAHEDIPGLMPAMTMNFEVPDRELLARLSPGQQIEFTLHFTGKSYRVVDVQVLAEGEPGEGWARFGDELVRADEAPPFSLIDQQGRPVSLEDLAGRTVLLDFVYTTCPGPCPILTSSHVSVQRALGEEARDRVWLVSISLDPSTDTPEALFEYARQRGADLSNWSFLTGPVEAVQEVVQAYGVGSTLAEDGSIDHLVVSFLIDGQGRILRRYLGLEHEPEQVARDLMNAS